MRRLVVVLALMTCGCAAPHGSPVIVTTPEQAIQLAQKACYPDDSKLKEGFVWRAERRPWRGNVWQVWLTSKDTPDGPRVDVWPDGTVGDCLETVTSIG